ncbi:cytochrome b561 isoform X2 [Cimex lectularius]|nr:cytochrome b561 isoform X2 [Cimex lectularius]
MEENLKGFNVAFAISQVLGVTCVVLVATWTSSYRNGFGWRSNPDLEFNWHPLLMTVGLIYLYANSIMIYRALRTMRKQKLKIFHAIIHSVVILCVLFAQIAVFDSHNFHVNPQTQKLDPIPNLYSLHSWIGLVAIITFILQWIGGLLVFLWPGASMTIRSAVMPWHVFIGLCAFVLALAAAVSGLNEKAIFSLNNYAALPGEGVLINLIGLMFVFFGITVVYIVTESNYKRHPRPEDGALLKTSPSD